MRRHLQDEILRIRERPLALTEGPSDETLSTIRRTFTLVRQDKKRLIILGVATVIMAALAAVSFAFGGYALSQKAVAEENARQTFLRQADLSASIAFRLFGEGRPVLGFKVARAGAPDVIQHATPLTKQLALALSRGWRQIQEEADLRHADGDVITAAWSPDGSRVVTSTLTDAPRAWSVANGEQLAVLGNGIRPDYYLVRDPSDLSFSADGRRLATQFGDTVSVWETATWARVLDVHCEAMEGRYLRLSPDGRSLAAQCKDGVHLWEITSKREMYHRDEVVQPDGVLPWLAAFEFADEGDTLVLVDDKSAAVGVLRHITTGTPEFASLTQVSSEVQRNAPAQGDQGFVSVHPTRVPAEIVLRSTNAVYRVDLVQDRIAWQMPFAADQKHWFQMLRSADAIATASLANDGDVEYRIARGPGGRALQEGRTTPVKTSEHEPTS